MPITRFEKLLKHSGQYDQYISLLQANFNPETLGEVMCRNLLSVDWEGSVYDCDFNQMLEMPLRDRQGNPLRIWDLSIEDVEDQPILIGNHCYACTAGSGSSCGGALVSQEKAYA